MFLCGAFRKALSEHMQSVLLFPFECTDMETLATLTGHCSNFAACSMKLCRLLLSPLLNQMQVTLLFLVTGDFLWYMTSHAVLSAVKTGSVFWG